MNENIYFIEYQSSGDSTVSREIVSASSIPMLFEEFSGMTDLTYFAFEDVTEQSVEDIEKRLMYRGKYSV